MLNGAEPKEKELGKFIVLEGIDGLGKTTAAEFVVETLKNKGLDVVHTREPGGTQLGEQLRDMLLHSTVPIVAEAELLLMFAARVQHLESVIYPALLKGTWVVSDRFTDASYAYQGGGCGVNREFIRFLEHFVQAQFNPNMVLVLDAPVHVGLGRLGVEHDRFEKEDIEFYTRVRNTYLDRANALQTHHIINAEKSIPEVHSELMDHLATIF